MPQVRILSLRPLRADSHRLSACFFYIVFSQDSNLHSPSFAKQKGHKIVATAASEARQSDAVTPTKKARLITRLFYYYVVDKQILLTEPFVPVYEYALSIQGFLSFYQLLFSYYADTCICNDYDISNLKFIPGMLAFQNTSNFIGTDVSIYLGGYN